MSDFMYVHTPVLLDEILEYVKPVKHDSLFVDATLGEGGYSYAFLHRFPGIKLAAVDRDPDILHIAKQRLAGFKDTVVYFHMWFDDFLSQYDTLMDTYPDRIIFDLGISRFHYEVSGRGFSFTKEEPLDMRLSDEISLTAYDIINTYSEEELFILFKQYGEEKFARRIAGNITRERQKAPIDNAWMLSEIIKGAVPKSVQYSSKIHPATRCFQALRIMVNSELKRLKNGLESAFEVLNTGGRIVVVSYHSLEDRIVKRFFREKNSECICPPDWPVCQCKGIKEARILTRKPVRPGTEEVEKNRAARSAKLRILEKIVPGRSG